jgi:hypothetical protein
MKQKAEPMRDTAQSSLSHGRRGLSSLHLIVHCTMEGDKPGAPVSATHGAMNLDRNRLLIHGLFRRFSVGAQAMSLFVSCTSLLPLILRRTMTI